jgi:hypothetical protein
MLLTIAGACQLFTGTGDLEVRDSGPSSSHGSGGEAVSTSATAAGGQGGAGGVVNCASGTDCPKEECATYACTDGVCVPSYEPNTTECGPPPACTNGMESPIDHCDGAGKCADSGTTSCDAYACNDLGNCNDTCTIDNECAATYSCIQGQCTKPGLGSPCSINEPCDMNLFCVDGVCCDTMCTGICQTCYGPNSQGSLPSGTCWPVKAGTDPDGECGDVMKCNGDSNSPACI